MWNIELKFARRVVDSVIQMELASHVPHAYQQAGSHGAVQCTYDDIVTYVGTVQPARPNLAFKRTTNYLGPNQILTHLEVTVMNYSPH